MKRIFVISFLFLAIFGFFLPNYSFAVEEKTDLKKIEFILFHSKDCIHCKAEIKFIDNSLRPKYSDYVDFKLYKINEPKNQELFSQYGYFYKTQVGGVPVAFIDGEVVHGYGNDETTGVQIVQIIEKKINDLKPKVEGEENFKNTSEIISIPMLGEINPKTFSLPLLTLIVGLLDGFNPCAMWVLLFLISLLLGIDNRKRMFLLGSIFIFSSGLVYFLFMTAWLSFLTFVGMIFVVRLVIGVVAIFVGGKNLGDYWKNRKNEGVVCEVSKNKNTQKIFGKIKDIVYRQSLWWSIMGIIILGFSVNLVELACSAGFPAIYTQVLSMSGLPIWQRYLYMVGYIIFYMLDDMIVFAIAMITLRSKIVGSKFAKYSNLIGGIIILILGILLIFKPTWLMLG